MQKKALVLGILIFFILTPLNLTATVRSSNEFKHNGEISIDEIWFNWGNESKAITLTDCDIKETPIKTPEFVASSGRNNPAAYVKGNYITVKVKFSSEQFSSVLIKANGSFGGFSEEQVVYNNGESDWISFTTIAPLENLIKTHNVEWEWQYYNTATEDWVNIDTLQHRIYSLNKKPLTDEVFEILARWTTEWCETLPPENQDDDKNIADAIMNGFDTDEVIKYGGRGWDTAEILRTGDGMCSGMSMVFFDACVVQGVKMIGFHFQLLDTSIFDPQFLWRGIVCSDPGLGRTKPGFGSVEIVHKWINETYPYPKYYSPDNENDDVDEQFTRVYIFYTFDGHVVNLMEYDNEILLYDLSFGKGPYLNTFSTIPAEGKYTSSQMRTFRNNYHDTAVDHMNGKIYYENSEGEIVLDFFDFNVKTSIIPDEIAGDNQILYRFNIIDYSKSFSQSRYFDDFYKDFFDGVMKNPESFRVSSNDIYIVENWLENPSDEIDWLVLRNAILMLGGFEGLMEKVYVKNLLNRVLNVKTDINVPEECSLPGIMSPLDMVKSAAIGSLEFLDSSHSISNNFVVKKSLFQFLKNHHNLFPVLQFLIGLK